MRRVWVGAVVVAGCLVFGGCGEEDAGAGGPGGAVGGGPFEVGAIPEIFSGYCTGTLLVAATPMTVPKVLEWEGAASTEVPAGTKFLLGDNIVTDTGYVFSTDGKPARLQIGGKQGFQREGNFEKDCPENAFYKRVLLADATLYGNKSLSGAACTVPAGTKFEGDYAHASGSSGAESVDSSVVEALCGLKPGYTSAFPAAELYPRE